MKFNVCTETARQLQSKLESGDLTSMEIVENYLDQIEKHNKSGLHLNAIISVLPRELAISIACRLDDERKSGYIRGPLHGIPIIIKDSIMTEASLSMDTTAGAYVFSGARAKKNAAVVDQLVEKGMIVLGKANLSEYCGLKAANMTPGWSALGGQTKSAYRKEYLDEKDQPISAGSSSGSAVGVSAGFAPLALGTETAGSNVYPASTNGLYAMKPSTGSTAMQGVCGLSRAFDGIGAMARTSGDLAVLVEAMMNSQGQKTIPDGGYLKYMSSGWEGLTVGFTSVTYGWAKKEKWSSPAIKSNYESVATKIIELGGKALYPVNAPEVDILTFEGKQGIEFVAFHEFKTLIEEFAAGFEDPKAQNLREIIEFNKKNAEKAMPKPFEDQDDLVKALNWQATDEEADAATIELRRLAGHDGIDKLMDAEGLDIVIAPSDTILVGFAACAGYPIATVPLGNMENGQPYGLFLLAKRHQELKLFQFMGAFEATFPEIERPQIP